MYLAGFTAADNGDDELASALRDRARTAPAALCFPAGLEALDALRAAVAVDPTDSRALDLLGMWNYAAGNHEQARDDWAAATALDPDDPVLLRDLALSLIATGGDESEAHRLYARALELTPNEGRLLLELDTLAERGGQSSESRLLRLDRSGATAHSRDDLIVRHARLLNDAGRHADALATLLEHRLQPWEGGEGSAIAEYERAHVALGRESLAVGKPARAAESARRALELPASLGEARLLDAALADIRVLQGDAAATSGDHALATEHWSAASMERSADARKLYWAGVAYIRLGDTGSATEVHRMLLTAASAASAPETADYFATSLPSTALFGDSPAAERRRGDRIRELAAELLRQIGAREDTGGAYRSSAAR
jgi:tetratricopeptide (TPR) repeat protein